MHRPIVRIAIIDITIMDLGFADSVELLHGRAVHQVRVLVQRPVELVVEGSLVEHLAM